MQKSRECFTPQSKMKIGFEVTEHYIYNTT